MISTDKQTSPLVLVTGATGYVGSRLLRELERRHVRTRCLVRRPETFSVCGGAGTDVAGGDVLDVDSLRSALRGVHTAYYLVHSMDASGQFEDLDRRAAANFAEAAAECGVERIIYLGGLADEQTELSPHLRSRHEVGQVLRSTGVPVIEFRASIVIGSGSLSFEMIRALVERLPVMIAPRWVAVPAQPIAISDLLEYLLQARDVEVDGSATFEIGGADRVSYGELMKQYARTRGLRRLIVPVPVLTPRLSSLWLGLVTPLYARVGRKLIDSIRHPSIVHDHAARRAFDVRPMDHRQAIATALFEEDTAYAEFEHSAAPPEPAPGVAARRGALGRFFDTRTVLVNRPPERVFAAIERIGGETGWYYGDWLWQLRGLMDRLVGGVGLRRGARGDELQVGDTLDCWRVVALQPARRLRLAAEMKLPGRAWLEFEVHRQGQFSRLRQTAEFDPRGVLGRAYWYLVYPLHQLVFGGMVRGIAAAGLVEGSVRPNPVRRGLWTQVLMLIGLLILCFAAAGVGAALTATSLDSWYPTLAKPSWNPPNWVFGPVWSLLYATMSVAAFLVWRRSDPHSGSAPWVLFAVQLALNVAWSGIFFGLRQPGWALAEIVVLWIAIAATMIAFAQRSRWAGWLLAPYLAWVSFAGVLNFAIWQLNA